MFCHCSGCPILLLNRSSNERSKFRLFGQCNAGNQNIAYIYINCLTLNVQWLLNNKNLKSLFMDKFNENNIGLEFNIGNFDMWYIDFLWL